MAKRLLVAAAIWTAAAIPTFGGADQNAPAPSAATSNPPAQNTPQTPTADLGNFSGFRQGTPDYERVINIVHDATVKAGVRLCGPIAWRDRPDFTCFQAGSETAAIARGVAAELGALANTQGQPEVGPFAPQPAR